MPLTLRIHKLYIARIFELACFRSFHLSSFFLHHQQLLHSFLPPTTPLLSSPPHTQHIYTMAAQVKIPLLLHTFPPSFTVQSRHDPHPFGLCTWSPLCHTQSKPIIFGCVCDSNSLAQIWIHLILVRTHTCNQSKTTYLTTSPVPFHLIERWKLRGIRPRRLLGRKR